MVASSSKKTEKTCASKLSRPKATTITKITLKENDRIARMKAAREAYNQLSKNRVLKHADVNGRVGHGVPPNLVKVSEERGSAKTAQARTTRVVHSENRESICKVQTNSPSRTFKPMASSLDMIRNNRIRIPTSGRASSIAGKKSLGPRPSLLPLGINVFDSNVSVTDQLKVREFVAAHMSSGATPRKASCSFNFNHQLEQSSSRGPRSVRFCVEATIDEQRESGSDELLEGYNLQSVSDPDQPSTSHGLAVPQSILKNRTKAALFCKPSSPKVSSRDSAVSRTTPRRKSLRSQKMSAFTPEPPRFKLSFASTESEESNRAHSKVQSPAVGAYHESDFVKAYTMLFNMSDEELENADPIMLDGLIELLQSIRKRMQSEAALRPNDSSFSLIALPDDISSVKPQSTGFRKVAARASSSADLQANQEVMLINESVQRQEVVSPYQRPSSSRVLRQRNPVSKTLGGDSPFFPIRGSPFF